MKLKNILALAMALVMVLSFAACGGNNGANNEATTTEPTTTEPQLPDTNMNYFSLTMGEDYDNVVNLIAYPNEDGSVSIEYSGSVRKVGTLDKAALNQIAATFEGTELASLNGQDEYQDGTANASMYISYTNEEGEEYLMVNYSGVIPEAFSTGFAAMETLFQTLTAEIPEYVPQPSVVGEVAESDKAALDAILAGMTLETPDAFMITGVANDEYMASTLGLSSVDGIASGVTFAPMMMSSAYSLSIVTLTDAANAETVAKDFVDSLDWLKWVCVQPSNALVAVKDNQVLCLMASDETYTMTASAIEAAGWTTYSALQNENM